MRLERVAQTIAAPQSADGRLELTLALTRLHALGDRIQRLQQRDARLQHQRHLTQNQHPFASLQAPFASLGLGGGGRLDPHDGQTVSGQSAHGHGLVGGADQPLDHPPVATGGLILEGQLVGHAVTGGKNRARAAGCVRRP
ncbi:hypothetical protein D3C72_1365770 [compost metagenome]